MGFNCTLRFAQATRNEERTKMLHSVCNHYLDISKTLGLASDSILGNVEIFDVTKICIKRNGKEG